MTKACSQQYLTGKVPQDNNEHRANPWIREAPHTCFHTRIHAHTHTPCHTPQWPGSWSLPQAARTPHPWCSARGCHAPLQQQQQQQLLC
eukprot:scaffold98104_cov19-Tisochrysis_lutea.AAC.1